MVLGIGAGVLGGVWVEFGNSFRSNVGNVLCVDIAQNIKFLGMLLKTHLCTVGMCLTVCVCGHIQSVLEASYLWKCVGCNSKFANIIMLEKLFDFR